MAKRHFNRLFGDAVEPGLTPEGLVERLSVEGLLKVQHRLRFSVGFEKSLSRFRKLRQADRLRHAQEYLLRNPQPPTQEAADAIRVGKIPKIFKAFGHDQNHPGSSFYDAMPCEYTAHTDGLETGPVHWRARHPTHRRKYVQYLFKDLVSIPPALIALAVRLGTAFRIEPKDAGPGQALYGVVLMPVGDRRAASFTSKPEENAHEVPGIPQGMALLFDGPFQEDIGMIAEWGGGGADGKTTLYGCSVWGRFYAIQYESALFECEPRIPAG